MCDLRQLGFICVTEFVLQPIVLATKAGQGISLEDNEAVLCGQPVVVVVDVLVFGGRISQKGWTSSRITTSLILLWYCGSADNIVYAQGLSRV